LADDEYATGSGSGSGSGRLQEGCQKLTLWAVKRATKPRLNFKSFQAAKCVLAALTAREREVAELMAAGKPNKIIARELAISDKTVQVHRHNTMEKLGMHSAAEIAQLLMAAKAGLFGSH